MRDAGYDPARLPPGQYLTEKWPVLHAGSVPSYPPDLAGWEPDIDAVEPADVVDVNNLDAASTQPYIIPFRQPILGDVELVVRAKKPLTGTTKEVDFALPRPRGNAVAPALVVVLPDDNIELRPLVAQVQGLTAESGVPPVKLPARQQPPLVYRDKGEAAATFAADFVP